MQYGHKVDQKLTDKLNQVLSPKLLEGEVPEFVGKTNSLKPMFNTLVITNYRVLGVMPDATDGFPVKMEVLRHSIQSHSYGTGIMSSGKLLIETAENITNNFGTIDGKDQELVSTLLSQAPAEAISEHIQEQLAAQSAEAGTALDPSIELIGPLPNAKSVRVVYENCTNNELPLFVLSSGAGAGILAAWADRLMIIKTGGWTSFMAGATGGGRVSTFYFKDINAIEYNSGFVTGVLEVLTASYTGSQTSDFWSSGKNDPWTLSNCLPLNKAEHGLATAKLQELRKWISDAKNQTIVVQGAAPASSLADELKKLTDLHAQGLINDDDLANAKAKLLS